MNDNAFETLFRNQFTPLSNLAYTLVKDTDTAKDIVQQVFVKFWHKRQELTIQGPVEAYLYRMVINTSLNHIKKEKKYTRLEYHLADTSDQTFEKQENSSKAEEKEKKVRKAINELPPQCQTVFSLSRFENLSNKEIANHLGISVKTVEKHITVALKTLRVKLRPLISSDLVLIFSILIIKFLILRVGFLIFCLS